MANLFLDTFYAADGWLFQRATAREMKTVTRDTSLARQPVCQHRKSGRCYPLLPQHTVGFRLSMQARSGKSSLDDIMGLARVT